VAYFHHSILPLCVEGSHLHRALFDTDGIPYVTEQCNALPSDPSDESISLRRIVLELYPPRHSHRAYSLNKLAGDLYGNEDHFYEAIHLSRKALAVCRADSVRILPGVLSGTLGHRSNHHGDPSDIHLQALDLRSSASSQRGITTPEQGQESDHHRPHYHHHQLPPPPPPPSRALMK